MNLFVLGTMLDNDQWKKIAHNMVSKLVKMIESEPSYLSNWGTCLATMTKGIFEVAIVGPQSKDFLKKFSLQFLPFALVQSTAEKSALPLLKDKETANGTTTVYVCFDRTCKLPVTSVEDALGQLK
jgi:uncharacterized protein YyaL (SSP411 family)